MTDADEGRARFPRVPPRLLPWLRRLLPWLRRLRPLWRWSAGVAAGVVVALITAWLVAPDRPPTPGDDRPFTVAMSWDWSPGAGWISDRPLAEVPPRPIGSLDLDRDDENRAEQARWAAWVRDGGAAHSSDWGVQFSVQGTSAAQVTLTELRIRVHGRRPAVRGTMFLEAGGDPGEFRHLAVDLDRSPPTMTAFYDPDWEFGTIPEPERRPIRFPYRVSLSDAETFIVRARATTCDCLWSMELDWASQGHTGTYVIDDGGKPFRTSGSANVTDVCTWFYGQKETCRPR